MISILNMHDLVWGFYHRELCLHTVFSCPLYIHLLACLSLLCTEDWGQACDPLTKKEKHIFKIYRLCMLYWEKQYSQTIKN